MLTPRTFQEHVATAQDDSLRVLVVGAAVAGVAVAQLLRRQAFHPVLVARSTSSIDAGYMLGLMPLVNEPLRRLGVWEQYRARSTGASAPTRWMRRWATMGAPAG